MSDVRDVERERELRLAPESIDAIARRVAELLSRREAPPRPRQLLTAAEVSAWWGVERSWVYTHADQLGARRLGSGERPRLRFDPDEVGERLAALHDAPAPHGRRSAAMPADSASTRPRRRAELSSSRNRSRPGGASTPPATAPKKRPSTR